MKPKLLCPKWGKCKAKKKCSLDEKTLKDFNIYVYGECANKNARVTSWFEEWDEAIKKM